MLIGNSGAGKTYLMLQMIRNREKLFDKPINKIVYCYSVFQPIFNDFPEVTFHEGLIKNVEEIFPASDGDMHHILVLDDQIMQMKRDVTQVKRFLTQLAPGKTQLLMDTYNKITNKPYSYACFDLSPGKEESRFEKLQSELYRIIKSNEHENIKKIAYSQILNQLLEEQKYLNAPTHVEIIKNTVPAAASAATGTVPAGTVLPTGTVPAGTVLPPPGTGVVGRPTGGGVKRLSKELKEYNLSSTEMVNAQRLLNELKNNRGVNWAVDGTNIKFFNTALDPNLKILDMIVDNVKNKDYDDSISTRSRKLNIKRNFLTTFLNQNTNTVPYRTIKSDGAKKKKKEEEDGRWDGKPGSFGGLKRLHDSLPKHIKKKDVESFLRSDDSYTLHKNARKRFPTPRTITYARNNIWQLDLGDLTRFSTYNSNYRPLKSKNAEEVAENLNDIFIKSRQLPGLIWTDAGLEFHNKIMKNMLDSYGIHLYTTYQPNKASMVERYIRSFKERLMRYLTFTKSYKYIHVLDKFISSYNSTVHRSTGRKPIDVQGQKHVALKRKRKLIKFKIGHRVRINRIKPVFTKGADQSWSSEIFLIHKVINNRDVALYILKDLNGEILRGAFVNEELQLIN
ncbi:unnamed protein product [Rotaria magnacalcarata]|uniref:Integrase catalytic domain-containing protein n=1 Tax=Rotaria magnacalcarata TaxID=392030 RepID=A0A819RFI1_9BILA|nr:unnamed protein product [Rotaria magnacalcarata]